jgi:hypothetical protein
MHFSFASIVRTFLVGLAFLAFLASSGFATSVLAQVGESKNLAPGFKQIPASAKLVLLPMDVELFSLSAGGVREPKADWTANAQKHMLAAIQARKKALGLNFSELGGTDAEDFSELSSLNAAVSGSIVIHHFLNLKLPTKEGKLDWSLGDSVKALQEKTNADYGLFVWVRDSYASGERKAMMLGMALLGIGISGGTQIGYASLVDLKTGQIVWFNFLGRSSGDLREAEPAAQSVNVLMGNFPSVAK